MTSIAERSVNDIQVELPANTQRGLKEGCYRGVIHVTRPDGEAIDYEAAIEFCWPTQDVMLLRNVVPEFTSVDEMIRDAQAADGWQPASCIGEGEDTEHYHQADHRNNDVLQVDSRKAPDLLTLETAMLCISNAAGFTYLGGNPWATVACDTGYQVLRYREGHYFKEHIDTVRAHRFLGLRRLSLVMFLQEPEKGGQLYFPRDDLTIEPTPNTAVVFPSGITHPHAALEVEEGTKIAVVTWYL